MAFSSIFICQQYFENNFSEIDFLQCLILLPAPSAPIITEDYTQHDCQIYDSSWKCNITIKWKPPTEINAKEITAYRVKYNTTKKVSKPLPGTATEIRIDELSK